MATRTRRSAEPKTAAAAPAPPAKKAPAARTSAPTKKVPQKKARVAARAALPQDRGALQRMLTGLGKIELTEIVAQLIGGWRRDLQTLIEASERSYAGLQSVVKRQTEQIAEAAGELRSVGQVMQMAGPAESARKLDALAAAALQLALNDVRELARLAASSQREAFDLVQQRVANNVDAVQRMLQR